MFSVCLNTHVMADRRVVNFTSKINKLSEPTGSGWYMLSKNIYTHLGP
jgi:hypothetical protein